MILFCARFIASLGVCVLLFLMVVRNVHFVLKKTYLKLAGTAAKKNTHLVVLRKNENTNPE
jgi:hypothetical protein